MLEIVSNTLKYERFVCGALSAAGGYQYWKKGTIVTKKIILDCDPGHDDAVALLLALGNPEIELVGVTTVGGNQSLDKVTYNARAVLEKAHATDVPVYAGCDRPIVRPQEVAASIHGESGLDGVELPVPTRPLEEKHAVNYIVETIMASEPGTITLVPTGPLTNIAMAVRMEPRIVERVKEVVLMGGGYHEVCCTIQNMVGNVTGMVCDGAKADCALKISTCVNAACQAAAMGVRGVRVQSTDGIVEHNVEYTLDNFATLSTHGTSDSVILDLMLNKHLPETE